jgi:hypothetical protein
MDRSLFPALPDKKLIEIVRDQNSEAVLVNGVFFMGWKRGEQESKRLASRQVKPGKGG